MTYAPLGPSIATEIQLMLDEGLTFTDISRKLGYSRDRIRTVIRKYQLTKPDRFSQFSRNQVTQWVERLIKGTTWAELAESEGVSKEKIRGYVKHYGFKLSEIKRLKSEHLHDGRTFGYWTVVPGSHARIRGNAMLTCECICGEKRQVSLSNLIGGCSLSCGCKGYEERTTYPWRCEETGEVLGSSKELAERIGVNPLGVYRQLHKGNEVITDGDFHWVCIRDAGVIGAAASNTWVCEETGEIIKGSQNIAELCMKPIHQINEAGRKRGYVVDVEGKKWNQVSNEND